MIPEESLVEDDALTALEAAVKAARAGEDAAALARALGRQAAVLWQSGELNPADELLLEQWRVSLAAGLEVGLYDSFRDLIALRRSRGDVDGIVALCVARHDAGSEAPGSEDTVVSMAELATELADERSTAASLRLLEAAECMAREGRDYRTTGGLMGRRARLLAEDGDVQQALDLTEQRLELARDEDLVDLEVETLCARAELLQSMGDVAGAVSARSEAEATARARDAREDLAQALADRRVAAVTQPDLPALSDREFSEAMNLALESDRPDLTAQLLWPDTPATYFAFEGAVKRASEAVTADALRRNRDFTLDNDKCRTALFFSDALMARADAALVSDDWSRKGLCHFKLDEQEEAIAAYHEALALDDADAQPPAGLAISLLKLGRIDDALSAARVAVALDADIGPLWFDLALGFLDQAESHLGFEERGINALRHGIEHAPHLAQTPIPDPATGEIVPAKELVVRYELMPVLGVEAVLAPPIEGAAL
jgi:tetratricopeptide (TPR) repeat protein